VRVRPVTASFPPLVISGATANPDGRLGLNTISVSAEISGSLLSIYGAYGLEDPCLLVLS
jgi:hypothetical protein